MYIISYRYIGVQYQDIYICMEIHYILTYVS